MESSEERTNDHRRIGSEVLEARVRSDAGISAGVNRAVSARDIRSRSIRSRGIRSRGIRSRTVWARDDATGDAARASQARDAAWRPWATDSRDNERDGGAGCAANRT